MDGLTVESLKKGGMAVLECIVRLELKFDMGSNTYGLG